MAPVRQTASVSFKFDIFVNVLLSKVVNLISDTVTLPTPEMKQAMLNAALGDDVFRQDPSVNELQTYAAGLFGFEDALFCASGTMANQIAVQVHTQALDEILCDVNSHIFQFETGGYAYNGRVAIQPLQCPEGKLSPSIIQQAIRPKFDWFANTRMVCVENTGNRTGGNYYSLEELKALSSFCREHQLRIHLDGARIFNACIEGNYTASDLCGLFDSISICLSKGLGAPVGSLLLSSKDNIEKARRIRKAMGGGMRQAGILAAAGLYALKHHIDRLKQDHWHARELYLALRDLPYVASIKPVFTNIVIFELTDNFSAQLFIQYLKSHQILAGSFGQRTIRFVTHLDVTSEMIQYTCRVLKGFGHH